MAKTYFCKKRVLNKDSFIFAKYSCPFMTKYEGGS